MGFDKRRKAIRILVVLLVILVVFAGYLVITNNPRFKIKMGIQTIFNKVDDTLMATQKSEFTNAFLKNKVEYTNRIVANSTLNNNTIKDYIAMPGADFQKLINNSTIKTNVKSDIPNKYLNVDLDYSYNDERILANTYIDNEQLYIQIQDYFDKILKINTEYFNAEEYFNQMTTKITVEEISYILNVIKFSIVDASEFATVTNSKEEVTIVDKKINLHKTTVVMDTDFIKKLQTIFSNKVLYDQKAKEILFKMGSYKDITELENLIKEELVNIQMRVEEYKKVAEYSLYTSGIFNKVVRNEFRYFDEKNIVVQYTTHDTIKFNKQISIYENNELLSQINIIEKPNNYYDITATKGRDMSLDISGTITEKLVEVNYTIRMSKHDDLKGDIRYELKNINSNEMNQNLILRLNTPESYGTAQVTMDSTLKIVNEITKPDFSNSVKIDSLTTDQLEAIIVNFQNKNPNMIKLVVDIINSLI